MIVSTQDPLHFGWLCILAPMQKRENWYEYKCDPS